jgi:hypothetical protein
MYSIIPCPRRDEGNKKIFARDIFGMVLFFMTYILNKGKLSNSWPSYIISISGDLTHVKDLIEHGIVERSGNLKVAVPQASVFLADLKLLPMGPR